MIKNKTYFMLLVSAFTFFGLSTIQNVNSFTSLLGQQKININIAAQEEENETSNNNEVKEVQSKLAAYQNKGINAILSNRLSQISFKVNASLYATTFFEVDTPPPKF